MGQCYFELFVHIIWGTKNRIPLINSDVEVIVHNIIKDKCKKFNSEVIAIGNIEDHIHLLLSIHPALKLSDLIAEIKGTSSFFINSQTNHILYWQDGYGVMSISTSVLPIVKKYVDNQKNHHKSLELLEYLEKPSTA